MFSRGRDRVRAGDGPRPPCSPPGAVRQGGPQRLPGRAARARPDRRHRTVCSCARDAVARCAGCWSAVCPDGVRRRSCPRAWLLVDRRAGDGRVRAAFYEVLHFRHLWTWLGLVAALVLVLDAAPRRSEAEDAMRRRSGPRRLPDAGARWLGNVSARALAIAGADRGDHRGRPAGRGRRGRHLRPAADAARAGRRAGRRWGCPAPWPTSWRPRRRERRTCGRLDGQIAVRRERRRHGAVARCGTVLLRRLFFPARLHRMLVRGRG